MAFASGRHFLQIPGPTNVPDRVLRAIDRPTIDHRGPAFAPPCSAAGRYDLVAWVNRLPARRVEGRRHRRRLAEGPHAPAGPLLQRRFAESARRVALRQAAPVLLGLAADAAGEREWLLPV